MPSRPAVVIQGAAGVADVPGLGDRRDGVDLRFAEDFDALRAALPGATVLLGWDFRADQLREAWGLADRLEWIHWSGAGVDALLFPELAASEVVLTNSRGVFDDAMAEYVLGLVVGFAKHFFETGRMQARRHWEHRLTERVAGRTALVVGVGSIGRAIARHLRAVGMRVDGIGRTARDGGPDFDRIDAVADLAGRLPEADFVVAITPLTGDTRGLFGAREFRCMKPTARFINVGRGDVVDEAALVEALRSGEIAAAALDVYEREPLPESSPLWALPNAVVSPHMSGDFAGHKGVLAGIFLDNLARFLAGEPLRNVVDKQRGY